eukprot:2231462-Pleurochrysis_carterae.AAC.5
MEHQKPPFSAGLHTKSGPRTGYCAGKYDAAAVSTGTQLTFENFWKRGHELPPFVVDNKSVVDFRMAIVDSPVGTVQVYTLLHNQQLESANARASVRTDSPGVCIALAFLHYSSRMPHPSDDNTPNHFVGALIRKGEAGRMNSGGKRAVDLFEDLRLCVKRRSDPDLSKLSAAEVEHKLLHGGSRDQPQPPLAVKAAGICTAASQTSSQPPDHEGAGSSSFPAAAGSRADLLGGGHSHHTPVKNLSITGVGAADAKAEAEVDAAPASAPASADGRHAATLELECGCQDPRANQRAAQYNQQPRGRDNNSRWRDRSRLPRPRSCCKGGRGYQARRSSSSCRCEDDVPD